MNRSVLIVLGTALLSAAGFGLILGVFWLTSHLVLGVFPYILHSRMHGMFGVLPVLCLWIAFIAVSCVASALAYRNKAAKQDHELPAHPKSGV